MGSSRQNAQFVWPPAAGPDSAIVDNALIVPRNSFFNITWMGGNMTNYNMSLFSLIHNTKPLEVFSHHISTDDKIQVFNWTAKPSLQGQTDDAYYFRINDDKFQSIRSGFIRIPDPTGSSGLSAGTIGGIVGGLVGALLLVFLSIVLFIMHRRRRQRSTKMVDDELTPQSSITPSSTPIETHQVTASKEYEQQTRNQILVDTSKPLPTQELHSAIISEMPEDAGIPELAGHGVTRREEV